MPCPAKPLLGRAAGFRWRPSRSAHQASRSGSCRRRGWGSRDVVEALRVWQAVGHGRRVRPAFLQPNYLKKPTRWPRGEVGVDADILLPRQEDGGVEPRHHVPAARSRPSTLHGRHHTRSRHSRDPYLSSLRGQHSLNTPAEPDHPTTLTNPALLSAQYHRISLRGGVPVRPGTDSSGGTHHEISSRE